MQSNIENKYQKKILTIPNLLSLFRICLIPVIVWLYCVKEDYLWTFVILMISGITDVVDGFIARHFGMVSDFGKAFDPVAVSNSLRGTLKVVGVKAPGYGDNRKEMLQDIAVLTGGQVVLDDLGMQLKDVTMEMPGRTKSVKVTKDSTVIVDGAGNEKAIEDRIESIRFQSANSTSDYDREKYMDRIAKLGGGVAVIRIEAATETEMKEAKYRMEDALNATRAAVEEGVIAGGGSACIHVQKQLGRLIQSLSGDERTGAEIVSRALEAPLRAIVENAGLEGAVIVNEVKQKEPGIGFDVLSATYADMMEKGIIDPVKVTTSALQNARRFGFPPNAKCGRCILDTPGKLVPGFPTIHKKR